MSTQITNEHTITQRNLFKKGIALSTITLVLIVLFLFARYYFRLIPFGEPIVIATNTGPDGTDIIITKIFHGDPLEPYIIDFWYRPPSSDLWYWHYIDHEALPWKWENIQIFFNSEGFADIFRSDDLIGSFDLTSHFFILTYDKRNREVEATGRHTAKHPLLLSISERRKM